MRRAFVGAALVVAGIAAFIEARSHRPESNYLCPEGHEPCIIGEGQQVHLHLATRGLSETAYDLLRIGGWALVIVGAVLIVVGLSRIGERSVTLALEFNDTFDLTAVGTLALALVTVISLVIAARALKQTKEEIEVSRREVEEAHRPVVVPTAVYWGVGKPKSNASIGLNNIGTGPALRITASLELLTTDGMRAGHGGEPKSVGGGGDRRRRDR